jgi:hypothetical protein
MSFASLVACGPSLDSLHATTRGGVMPAGAPSLRATHTIAIAAPPADVWAVLTDLPHWNAWHPAIRSAVPSAPLAVDVPFVWDQEGTVIHSRFAVVDSARTLAWTGGVSVASAVHIWRLSAADGGTRVDVEESMWGPGLRLFYTQSKLDANVDAWLWDLKKETERRAGTNPEGVAR